MLTFKLNPNYVKDLNIELKVQIRIGLNLQLKSPFLVQDPSDPFENFY
jgi:hypothetical protein